MRIHILIGIAVIILTPFFNLSFLEMALLFLTVTLVIVCEMINTALELSLDFLKGKEFNPSIQLIKDIAAGSVLISIINAIVIGLVIFLKHF